MIQDVGNIELCELLETEPKTQCTACLSYWSRGIVMHCTCGHLLKESEASRSVIQCALDFLSIPECVIKKGRLHGPRYGKLQPIEEEMQKEKVPNGIHDLFLRDHEFRIRMLIIIEMKKFVDDLMLLQMKITLIIFQKKEYFYYKNKWWLHLNKSGSDTFPLRKRSDFKQALSTLERLHQAVGEEPFVPTYSYKHKQWQLASSLSSTWCEWQDSWWSTCK